MMPSRGRRNDAPGVQSASSLVAWLQERQYRTAYHWTATRNRPAEYALRSRVVLQLLDEALGRRQPTGTGRVRLLDVGCGDGRFLHDAAGRAELHGVDVSERALRHAAARVPSARLLHGRADALRLSSRSFDAVTLLDVIEHLPDGVDRVALDEAHRVLRPGGVLVISTNSDRSAVEWKHYRHYSVERFGALFDERFGAPRLVGLVPYVSGLRFAMQAPLLWRLLRGRVRVCSPEEGQVLVGAATRR